MPSAQHMKMQVKHTLAAMRTGIDDETIPGIGNPLQFGNLVAGQHQMPKESTIRILQFRDRGRMPSRNDEHVCRRLGIDIVECNHQIVFVDEGCRDCPCHDFAKETLAHEVCPFLKPDFPNRAANS